MKYWVELLSTSLSEFVALVFPLPLICNLAPGAFVPIPTSPLSKTDNRLAGVAAPFWTSSAVVEDVVPVLLTCNWAVGAESPIPTNPDLKVAA